MPALAQTTPFLLLFLAEADHFIVGAPYLLGSDRLQVLALELDVGLELLRQLGAAEKGSLLHHAAVQTSVGLVDEGDVHLFGVLVDFEVVRLLAVCGGELEGGFGGEFSSRARGALF